MYLSIDFGTSSLKIALLDQDFQPVETAKEEYPYHILPGEKVEIDPDDLLKALTAACSRLDPEKRKQVDVLVYDTFSPSLMLMNEAGAALYPVVTHMDRRSRAQSNYICDVMGKERFQAITGVYPFTGGTSVLSLIWFMQNEPELMGQVRRIGHLTTFIHKYLTGQWGVDLVNASMMGLYDTVGQTGWSEEILSTFGIKREWLSDIITPGKPFGKLLHSVAQELGLPEDLPVTMGTNDAIASQSGAGNHKSGQILDIAGSSDMVSILTDTPALHPGYYVRNAARPGLWQIYATTSGGFALDWFREQFCRELSDDQFFGEYLPHCCSIAENEVTFDPYLSEDRQSLERRQAAWHHLSLKSTRDDMLASLLYSMQMVLRQVVDLAAESIPLEKTLKVTGGLASPPVFALKQRLFPEYDLTLVAEGTLKGNAALAANYKE